MNLKDILQKESIDISNLENALNTQVLLTITDKEGRISVRNNPATFTIKLPKRDID